MTYLSARLTDRLFQKVLITERMGPDSMTRFPLVCPRSKECDINHLGSEALDQLSAPPIETSPSVYLS